MRTARWVLVLLGVALLVIAIQGVPGALLGPSYLFNPWHYAVLNRVFEHPGLLATGGVVVLLGAFAVSVRRPFLRFGALGVVVLAVGAAVWLGTPVSDEPGLPTGGRRTTEYPSPDGRYTARVTTWQKLQGRVWLVMVRSDAGVRSREHLVGCQDGGKGSPDLDRVAWVSPDTIRLFRNDGEEYDFRLDPATAEPDHELHGGDVDACYQP